MLSSFVLCAAVLSLRAQHVHRVSLRFCRFGSVLLSYRLFNIVSAESVNLCASTDWFKQGCLWDPQTMIVTTSVLISIFLITPVVDRIWVVSVDFSITSSVSFGSVEENNVWTHAVYFPSTSVCVFIMFFKYLNSRTSDGLLFALIITHLMKAVFFCLNKFSCKMFKITMLIF